MKCPNCKQSLIPKGSNVNLISHKCGEGNIEYSINMGKKDLVNKIRLARKNGYNSVRVPKDIKNI